QTLCGGRPVVYVATAEVSDDPEMRFRIARHRSSRPLEWTTVEEPLEVLEAIESRVPERAIVLVDCVTLWISNLMWAHRAKVPEEVERVVIELVDAVAGVGRRRDLILVTNEVGQGIVPIEPIGRRFRDLQGFVNQRLAQAADRVVLLVAGLPL